MKPNVRRRRLVTVPAALLSLLLLGGAEGVDKSELECEEAVKHLIDCCPSDAQAKLVDCYAGRVCDNRRPDLSSAQSACITGASCDDLFASGACDAPKTACQ
jgi:hypothetical protein